jgi:hypothetical protein
MRTCFLAGMILVCSAAAQTIPYAANYEWGHLIPYANHWEGPWALELVPVNGGRSGKVWLRETGEGIQFPSRRLPARLTTMS